MNICPELRVGFVLLPRFTLTAFAGFVDTLRLAADEGDGSRPLRCAWSVLGETGKFIESSCGVRIVPTDSRVELERFDYIVVVGGLLQGMRNLPVEALALLRQASKAGVKLVGLCTGSFVLARAGLLDGHLACVSWFHREDFVREFPGCRVVSNQMYVVDRDRLTCAGGTSVVHLAAYVVERALDRSSAVKALRILIEREPLPARTLQPEQALSGSARDSVVRKAMLAIEQNLSKPARVGDLARSLQISRRQLVRRFRHDIGISPIQYQQQLRLERSQWLLGSTDLQVAEVAAECGFGSSSQFCRLIRKRFKRTPLQLRSANSCASSRSNAST